MNLIKYPTLEQVITCLTSGLELELILRQKGISQLPIAVKWSASMSNTRQLQSVLSLEGLRILLIKIQKQPTENGQENTDSRG